MASSCSSGHFSKLGFTQFKRRRQGNLQVGGTERPGVPECRGQRPTVRNLPTWRRARAMASTKVGDGLSYQAALRWVMGRRFCNAWAARVVQEKSPRGGRGTGDGEIGPLALCLHTQWVRTSWKVTLPVRLGRVRRRGTEQGLSGEGALGVSDQHPPNEDGGLAGAVPDRRLGGEFHGAGDAVVPGHLGAGPSYIRLLISAAAAAGPSMAGDRSGQVDGVALAQRAASRRNLAIRVTGSRRDWQQWSKSSSCCRPPAPGVAAAASGAVSIWRAQW